MEPSLIEAFIFKTICFTTCLAAVLYVVTKILSENANKAVEPKEPDLKPEPPAEPEKHGGIKCAACGKDDPDRKAFVNEGCKHIVCEKCVGGLGSRTTLLKNLQLCPDHVYRVRLQDSSCKVCEHKKGYLRPYIRPTARAPPTISTLPNLYKLASGMVEVVVGAKTSTCQTFTAPESILTGRSKNFARRLQGNTHSAKDRRLKLPDHDPRIFAYILEFMYSGRITDEAIGTDSNPTIYDVFDIWTLATFLEMDELCNYCAWLILTRYDAGTKLDFSTLGNKFETKLASQWMKKLIIDLAVWTEDGIGTWYTETRTGELLSAWGKELRRRARMVPAVNPLDKVENYFVPVQAPPPSTTI